LRDHEHGHEWERDRARPGVVAEVDLEGVDAGRAYVEAGEVAREVRRLQPDRDDPRTGVGVHRELFDRRAEPAGQHAARRVALGNGVEVAASGQRLVGGEVQGRTGRCVRDVDAERHHPTDRCERILGLERDAGLRRRWSGRDGRGAGRRGRRRPERGHGGDGDGDEEWSTPPAQ
jgi:hypothetical protein